MRTGTSVNSARWAARKRRAPATISYPSLLGLTVMGWISPGCEDFGELGQLGFRRRCGVGWWWTLDA